MADRRSADSGDLPVVVGAAQVVQRPIEGAPAEGVLGPLELMAAAARRAGEDACCPELLQEVGWIGVAGGYWSYRDPGRWLAAEVGNPRAGTALSPISGSAPLEMVAMAAERIQRGEISVALVVGGEARWSRQWFKRRGQRLPWQTESGVGIPEAVSGFPDEMMEEAALIGAPAPAYALMEDSLRAASGRSVEQQTEVIASLWERFSRVAATNEFAWDRTPHSSLAIATPSAANRMISTPYTKAMVANNTVDMSSAVLLAGQSVAQRMGVPASRWVYPHAAAACHEEWRMADRPSLRSLPALARASEALYGRAEVGPGEMEHVDLYACFPAIVQMSVPALGLDPDRRLTLTGGLGFAGAPIGNAAGQSVAAVVEAVRAGGWGLVHANGGNATKHCVAIFGAHSPARFMFDRLGRDSGGGSPPLRASEGDRALVEAATVVYARTGPDHVVAALQVQGRRCFAHSREEAAIQGALLGDLAGREARLTGDDTFRT